MEDLKQFLKTLNLVMWQEYKEVGTYEVDECGCENTSEHAGHMCKEMPVKLRHLYKALIIMDQDNRDVIR